MVKKILVAVVFTACCVGVGHAQSLLIDFNSLSQDGGPHNQDGYQAYEASHETPADFTADSFPAFGTNVKIQPTWPDTTDANVQQMIDRGNQADPLAPAGFDATWLDGDGTAPNTLGLNLVTDFLGIDTRTANGGNGDWDGTTGVPTTMLLTITELPADDYSWTSYHHDTEHVHGEFEVQISTDGGATFAAMPNGIMTDGSEMGNPDSTAGTGMWGAGVLATTKAEMQAAGSIYNMSFTADGTNDVVIQFQPYAGVAVHEQIWGMNGFELVQGVVTTDPTCDGDSDGECDIDDFNAMYDQAGSAGTFDFDGNGTVGPEDIDGWLASALNPAHNTTVPTDAVGLAVGDLNLDYRVDSIDLGLLLNNFGAPVQHAGDGPGWGGGDVTMNGSVDSVDLGQLLNNFGFNGLMPFAAAVPEPASASLLLLAGLGLLGFRRRA